MSLIKQLLYGDWGLGIGDWGLGIGDWVQCAMHNAQLPSPPPQSPCLNNKHF